MFPKVPQPSSNQEDKMCHFKFIKHERRVTVNPNRSNFLYSAAKRPHSGDVKIEILLLLYISKFKEKRAKMPLSIFYSDLGISLIPIFELYHFPRWIK